ncbi:phosphopantetheinyl transferase [Pantoea allii]|uniref:Phosphopantetheinyl transferase n=2 Tax=Erwiniaceae TaxID=1903409 RepID=A0A2V2BIP2_9GAMM|nr:phosphopantetheinyl transferase [Pantoea allii]
MPNAAARESAYNPADDYLTILMERQMAGHFVRWAGNPGQRLVDMTMTQDVIDSVRHVADKRRERFLAARIILKQLMQRVYGLHHLPPIVNCHNGRPAFVDPDLPDFNIAYAGNTVGVLLAEERSQVGLEIDIVRAHSRQTQEQMMQGLSSGEITWINAQQDVPEAVTQIWTLRRSVMKLQGGDETGLTSLQLLPGAGRLRSTLHTDLQILCDAEPTLVWSCALSPQVRHLHLWEITGDGQWSELRDITLDKPDAGTQMIRLTTLNGRALALS